jgi:hypothetical protein
MTTLEQRIFSAREHILEKIAACDIVFDGLRKPKSARTPRTSGRSKSATLSSAWSHRR